MHRSHRLQQVFTEQFRAMDIAEPLPSFDAEREASEVRRLMEALGAPVAGLRTSGHVRGFVQVEDLGAGQAMEHLRPFGDGQVLDERAGLHSAIEVLDQHGRCFLATLDTVDALVTRDDIDKPAARMWLFGNVTVLEMLMGQMIEQRYSGARWRSAISPARVAKAADLQRERRRRGQRSSLLDCLQWSDKAKILLKDDDVLEMAGFPSRKAAKDSIKRMESLRNSLAHSQPILPDDWPAVARLARRIETLIGRLNSWAELVERARAFAMEAHDRISHKRKYTQEPYWVHLEAVASMVGEVIRDPEVLAAAWLHDVVEDTPVKIEELTRRFGERVAGLVDQLTDRSRAEDGNRARRKEIDREHAALASAEAKTIKLADMTDNIRSISANDPEFGRVYLAEKEAMIAVLHEGDSRLLARAADALLRARDLLN